ncbi:MAG TPA: anti-sigma factor [Gaiellaceae bacterium]|nr:anti-sigma factor [Gaiellaceae bacterium]
MTTVPDIPIVQLPALDPDGGTGDSRSAPASIWAVDIPHGRRLTPVLLAALGVLAGIAAMAVGTAAVISAGSSAEPAPVATTQTEGVTTPPVQPDVPAERRVLSLLAKPSTERVAFRGARGLVLAVGSGGRAAILVRGLTEAPAGTSYGAWILSPGRGPVRAAQFTGVERAVFLSRPLGPRASVVISTRRPTATAPGRNARVAVRG